MMIRCLAIDDEPLALQQLATYINRSPFLTLVKPCNSALDAVQQLAMSSIDAIFVDINMPDMTGLEFVRTIANPPLVVFTTAYEEYAIDSYKVDAVDYLLKPFGQDEFDRAAAKLKARYDMMKQAQQASPADEDDTLFLKNDYKIVRVNYRDIVYIEAMSEYLRIYLKGKTSPLVVLLSMKRIEEQLPSTQFMRIHRSYIVNLKLVAEVSKNRLALTTGAELPIGDSYRDEFNAYVNSRFISK